MDSFMLLTPHTTKNIGADNTKQANTNTMAATVWMPPASNVEMQK
jgi:hypothetical protein